MTRTCALIVAILLPAWTAAAQTAPAVATGAPGHWTLVTGETVSPDRDAIGFELGWPGISFSYLHGTSDRTDVGARFNLVFRFENTTHTAFGAGVDVPFRLVVNRSNKVSVALHIDPGLRIYTRNSQTDFMTRLPGPPGAAPGRVGGPEHGGQLDAHRLFRNQPAVRPRGGVRGGSQSPGGPEHEVRAAILYVHRKPDGLRFHHADHDRLPHVGGDLRERNLTRADPAVRSLRGKATGDPAQGPVRGPVAASEPLARGGWAYGLLLSRGRRSAAGHGPRGGRILRGHQRTGQHLAMNGAGPVLGGPGRCSDRVSRRVAGEACAARRGGACDPAAPAGDVRPDGRGQAGPAALSRPHDGRQHGWGADPGGDGHPRGRDAAAGRVRGRSAHRRSRAALSLGSRPRRRGARRLEHGRAGRALGAQRSGGADRVDEADRCGAPVVGAGPRDHS